MLELAALSFSLVTALGAFSMYFLCSTVGVLGGPSSIVDGYEIFVIGS